MYAERVARLEKEAQSLKGVSEEVFRMQKQIDGEKAERESASGQLQSDLQQLLSEILAFTCSAGSCMFLSVSHFSGYRAWARQNWPRACRAKAIYLPNPSTNRLHVQSTLHNCCNILLRVIAHYVIKTSAVMHPLRSPTTCAGAAQSGT